MCLSEHENEAWRSKKQSIIRSKKMVVVVVNRIKRGGKVKKNISQKKGRRGLASSHEHVLLK